MKRLLLIVFTCSIFIKGFSQSVGIGTTSPDSSAELDVHSTTKGFLPPRVALTATNIASPISNPAAGLLVYDTVTSGSSPYDVSPGYYYWNGASWYSVINKGKAFGDMEYWDSTRWVLIPIGAEGSVLNVCHGIPHWGSCIDSVLSISPIDNPYEGYFDSYNGIFASGNTQVDMAAWTSNSQSELQRGLIKFDFNSIPVGATIDSAKMYLYATPTPQGGDLVDAMYGSSDAAYIQRVTSAWTLPMSFTWSNQPTVTTTDEATIPQSTSASENDVVDVTALVQDMQTNGNNGFFFILQDEVTYNIRQYASSFNTNASLHPRLVISYH